MKRLTAAILLLAMSLCLQSCGGMFRENPPETEGGTVPVALQVMDDEDVSLMARLVAAEAGGMPYKTQVCLAAMILNRLSDPAFPDTIRDIVYNSSDFESVKRDLVSAHPDGNEDTPKYKIALRAVKEALEGEDPTHGALYFSRVGSADMFVSGGYECGGMIFGK